MILEMMRWMRGSREWDMDCLSCSLSRFNHVIVVIWSMRLLVMLGARIYFPHHILLDWSDKSCSQIFKIILHDLALPNIEVSEVQARFDMTMVTINSGMERNVLQFTMLLGRAGLKITGGWTWSDKDGVIEAEVEFAA